VAIASQELVGTKGHNSMRSNRLVT